MIVPLILALLALGAWVSTRQSAEPVEASKPIVVTPRGPRITYPASRSPILTLPDGERRAVRSILNVGRTMKFGDFVWNDAGVPDGPVWVRVDLGKQIMSVFRAGHEIGSAVVLYGTDGKPTPTGVFPVMEKSRDHVSNLYDAEMPFMLRLTNDGVAIHASAVRRGRATHGCVGVPIAFAEQLFEAIKRGDRVAIIA